MRVVIIGNGPAAVAAAEVARDLDGGCDISIISREAVPFYSPCPLAEYVEGSLRREQLFPRDQGFYQERRIRTLLGRPATGVDTAARLVRLEDGEAIEYDRLLVATGARAVMPAIPGLAETPGVFCLKTLADADGILAHLGRARSAVVIGSGLIGLEAAQGLVRRGLRVTVVEALRQVLPRMLDQEMASLVERRLADHGIEVLTGSPAEAVVAGPAGIAAVMAGGHEIPCQLAVVAAGVRPDLSVLAGSGVATFTGILVNDRMETSRPGVYAAGDIVEAPDAEGRRRVLPNWPNAVDGGRAAGFNMMGVERRFRGLESFNVLRIFDLPVSSFGVQRGERTLLRQAGGAVEKLVLTGGRIVGGQTFGTVDRVGIHRELMRKGRDVSAFGTGLLDPRFGYGRLMAPPPRPAAPPAA